MEILNTFSTPVLSLVAVAILFLTRPTLGYLRSRKKLKRVAPLAYLSRSEFKKVLFTLPSRNNLTSPSNRLDVRTKRLHLVRNETPLSSNSTLKRVIEFRPSIGGRKALIKGSMDFQEDCLKYNS